MSTKKDLVEAHAFSRRRLVTAFVSGAPGGREVEPSRPGRTIVGGVALGVLVLAGGAIAGVFSGRPPDGWLDPGLVIEEETGNSYVITEESEDPVLRPVVGNVNARLIFGTDLEPSTVSAEDIAGQRIGDDIGILGAPAVLPSVDQLVDSGWVACTGDEAGVRIDVSSTPQAQPAPESGLVVRAEVRGKEQFWLIGTGEVEGDPDDQAFRYRLPTNSGTRSLMLGQLDLESSTQPTVSEGWLNLWPSGDPLYPESFDTGQGRVEESTEWFDGLDRPAEAGDVVEVRGAQYLVTQDGPAALQPFDAAVYRALADDPEPLVADDIQGGDTSPATPDGWPDAVPEAVGDGSVCAMLVTRPDEKPPTILVADSPTGDVDPTLDDELAAGEPSVTVEPGRGAFVVSGAFGMGAGPTPLVVDGKGVRYQLEGYDAIVNLGYGESEPRVVPDTWLTPFGCGVVLSRNGALGEPTRETLSSCADED